MPRVYEIPTNEDAHAKLFASYGGEGQWVVVRDDALDYPLLIRVSVLDLPGAEDELVCTGLLLGAPDGGWRITARALRDVPLVPILQEIAARASESQGVDGFAFASIVDGARHNRVAMRASGSHGRPAGFYVEVLEHYRRALDAAPSAPFKYIHEHGLLYGSDSSVRRWVREAKRKEAAGELEGMVS